MATDPVDGSPPFAVRVRRVAADESRAYSRNHVFSIGPQVGLRDADSHPSALEYLVGALGGDLIRGLEAQAARRSLAVHAMELSLTARLDNVLVHLGVIGESGHPGLADISGTLHVASDADEETLASLWRTTLERSPLYHTLSRCARVDIQLRSAY